MGEFVEAAEQIFIGIVHDMCLPEPLRAYRPLGPESYLHKLGEDGCLVFEEQQIVFKVLSRGRGQAKALNQEFMCLNALNNIAFEKEDVLTPLACFFDYLGFKAICLAFPPVRRESMTTGRVDSTYSISENNFDLLQHCSSMLNMAPIHVLPVYLSTTIEVHKIDSDVYNDVLKVIDQFSPLLDQKREARHHWLLFNLGVFWPRIFKTQLWFRPEFVLSWEKGFGDPEDYYNLADASKNLNSVVVDVIVKKLFDVEEIPIDSSSISQIMHSCSANIALIGLVMKKITFPHIKEILIIEMIARTAKRVFLTSVAELVAELANRDPPKDTSGQQLFEAMRQEAEDRLKSYYEDFFNLMFSKCKQSQEFYLKILYPQMNDMFKLEYSDYKAVHPPEVTPGGLMHALVYHTGLEIDIKNSTLFFDDDPAPFKPAEIKGFLASRKHFNLECLKVKKYSKQYYRQKNDPDKYETTKMQLSYLVKAEKAFPHNALGPAPLAYFQAELAELIVDEDEGQAMELAKGAI
jgi:hypothetical protein